jgi:hypothetical protein
LPGSNLPGSNLPGSNLPGSNLPGSNLLCMMHVLSHEMPYERVLMHMCRHIVAARLDSYSTQPWLQCMLPDQMNKQTSMKPFPQWYKKLRPIDIRTTTILPRTKACQYNAKPTETNLLHASRQCYNTRRGLPCGICKCLWARVPASQL